MMFNKVSPVVVSKVVQRDRLLNLLDGIPDGRAFWLAGPGGCGKTTLIAGLLARDNWPCLWYRVDALDGDPATFFYYMGQAASPLLEGDHPMPLLSEENADGVEIFALRYFEQLFQRIRRPCWLVFDNIQDASDEQGLINLLALALQRLPNRCNLAMLSRSDPPPLLVRFLVERRLNLIAWPRFAFTCDELRTFFALTEKTLSDGELGKLHQATRGWIAGAVLWSLHPEGSSSFRESVGGVSPERIFDFFMTEVFEKAEGRQRDCLLRIAIMPSFTMSMAAALLGGTEAEVEELVLRSGFFIERCHRLFDSYTFHPLFRAFLLRRIEHTFEVSDLRVLPRQAAEILMGEGQIEDAASLLRQAGDYRALRELILDHGRGLVAQGRCVLLASWIEDFSSQYLHEYPWLLYWKGVTHVRLEPDKGSRWCVEAFVRFKAQGDLIGQVCSWSMAVNLVIVARRGFMVLDRWILEGQRMGEQVSAAELPGEHLAQFYGGMLLALLLRDLGHPQLEIWRTRCEALFRDCEDDMVALELMKTLCWSYFWFGKTPCKNAVVSRLHHFSGKTGLAPVLYILVRVLLAQVSVNRGDTKECRHLVEEGLRQGQSSGVRIFEVMLETFSGYARLADGDVREMPALIGRINACLPPYAVWDQASSCNLAGWYHLELGDLEESARQAATAIDLVAACGNPFTVALCQQLQALVFLEVGDIDAAAELLQVISAASWLARSPVLRAMVHLTLAECHWQRRDAAAAAPLYRSAFFTLRDENFWVPYEFYSGEAR